MNILNRDLEINYYFKLKKVDKNSSDDHELIIKKK